MHGPEVPIQTSAGALREALAAEEAEPERALALYDELEAANRHFYADAALAAISLPTLAAVLSFHLGRIVPQYREALAVLLWLLAYLPLFMIFEKHELQKGFRYPAGIEGKTWRASNVGLFALTAFFEASLIVLYIGAVAFLIALPFAVVSFVIERFGAAVPHGVLVATSVISLVIAAAWVFSGLRTPIRPARILIPDIAAGVWRHRRDILQFLAQLSAGALLVGGGLLGLLFVDLEQSFFAGALAGLMQALTCYSHAGREPIAETLIHLGRARCLLRKGRKAAARGELIEIEESPSLAVTPALENLANALSTIEGSWQEEGRAPQYDIYANLQRAADATPDGGPDAGLWQDAIRLTWSLSGLAPLQGTADDLYAIMREPANPVWKRVIAGQTLARVGDFRLCHDLWYLPDEPFLGFVEIPEGRFTMGEGGQAHEVFLPTFYIGRHPVTQAAFRTFAVNTRFPVQFWESMKDHYYNEPVDSVLWPEALAYCEWLGKNLRKLASARLAKPQRAATETERRFLEELRDGALTLTLPSEAEWEKAARSSDGRRFPWGNDADLNALNCWENGIETHSPIGCFPSGASPHGVEDLLGAGAQWTRSLYSDYPYRPTPARESLSARGEGVLRGSEVYVRAGARAARRLRCNRQGNAGVAFRLALVSTMFVAR